MEELSRNAAEVFSEQAERSIRERGRCLVALNGGGTPRRLFDLLGTEFRGKIDWSSIHIFWGDERLVPAEDPESSYGQARDLFLRRVPIPETNVHLVDGTLGSQEAVSDYARQLGQFAASPLPYPQLDLVYLGMGEDGHTASLFPGSPIDVQEPVIAVTAQYQNRPAQRITLTPVVFNAARTIVFMATGDQKAATLSQVLSGRYNPELYPAQRIEPKNGRTLWLVDEDAASKLPSNLVRKFCEG